MTTVQPKTALKESDFQEHILHTLDVVLDQYNEWTEVRHAIHAQVGFDFRLTGPTVDEAGDAMYHIRILADALRCLANVIDAEVDDTEDLWQTCLTD